MIKSSEYMPLDDLIEAKVIPLFRTKKEAQGFIQEVGASGLAPVRVERRFERGWIVARHYEAPEVIGIVEFDVYSVPTQAQESNNVTQYRRFVRIKKYIDKEEMN